MLLTTLKKVFVATNVNYMSYFSTPYTNTPNDKVIRVLNKLKTSKTPYSTYGSKIVRTVRTTCSRRNLSKYSKHVATEWTSSKF